MPRIPQRAGRLAFDAATFGDHPYGSAAMAPMESVAALTRDDMLAAHKGALARDRIYVAAVGDITAAELGALLDMLLGGSARYRRTVAAACRICADRRRDGAGFPGPQSVIRLARAALRCDDPDFFAAYLMNEMLGGGRFTLAADDRGARKARADLWHRHLSCRDGSWPKLIMGQFATSQ